MTAEQDEREQRQYLLMRERVSGLRSGALYIGVVIADLEGLLAALEHAPEDWEHRFREEWSVLEIAYAVALHRQESIPTAASDYQIREALDALDLLIDERVAERT
jgi:hypothetical protein